MALDLLARRAAGPMRLAAITLIKRVATSEVPQWMGRQIEASRPLMPCPLSLLLIPDSSVLKPLRGGARPLRYMWGTLMADGTARKTSI